MCAIVPTAFGFLGSLASSSRITEYLVQMDTWMTTILSLPRFKVVIKTVGDDYEKKALVADALIFSQYARPYINHERVMTGYRHTEYAEGDLLLDIIKQGLVAKHIAAGDGYRSISSNT